MENIEKYIFDPENPDKFLAYDLLLKIIKDRNNLVFIDPYFFVEIFEKEIFDEETVKEIWDKPDNFEELSGVEKAKKYKNHFSTERFYNFIYQKTKHFKKNKFYNLFDWFISLSSDWYKHLHTTGEIKLGKSKDPNISLFYFFFEESLFVKSVNKVVFNKLVKTPKNLIFLFRSNNCDLIKLFSLEKDAILLTTIQDYQKKLTNFSFPTTLKPILFKDINDIWELLKFVHNRINVLDLEELKLKGISNVSFANLKNYFSLKKITLSNLNNKKEIYFIGENGDGKTILLQAILLALKGNKNEGVVIDVVKENPHKPLLLTATDEKGTKYEYKENPKAKTHSYENIFAYGVNRFRNDSDQQDKQGYLSLFNHDQYLENPVKWLQHLDYKEAKGDHSAISLAKAKEILSNLLDGNVTIEVSPDGVIFTERGTVLKFNQLSDGYKSVIVWVSDLIARLAENQPYVDEIQDFRGIVLVDEIGVYLHPKWQYSIVRKLRNWLPHVQFMLTTHSPMVVLGASKDAVFYKVYKENGETKLGQAVENKSMAHLLANGMITSPLLFGLPDARNAAFDPKTQEIDTSDDYLYSKIHKAISQRIADQHGITEDEIMNLIKQELDAYEAETAAENDKN